LRSPFSSPGRWRRAGGLVRSTLSQYAGIYRTGGLQGCAGYLSAAGRGAQADLLVRVLAPSEPVFVDAPAR
jgi:hypothetical protein